MRNISRQTQYDKGDKVCLYRRLFIYEVPKDCRLVNNHAQCYFVYVSYFSFALGWVSHDSWFKNSTSEDAELFILFTHPVCKLQCMLAWVCVCVSVYVTPTRAHFNACFALLYCFELSHSFSLSFSYYLSFSVHQEAKSTHIGKCRHRLRAPEAAVMNEWMNEWMTANEEKGRPLKTHSQEHSSQVTVGASNSCICFQKQTIKMQLCCEKLVAFCHWCTHTDSGSDAMEDLPKYTQLDFPYNSLEFLHTGMFVKKIRKWSYVTISVYNNLWKRLVMCCGFLVFFLCIIWVQTTCFFNSVLLINLALKHLSVSF